jgi:RNA polymerase sigma-70 factor (ECF subfamily)
MAEAIAQFSHRPETTYQPGNEADFERLYQNSYGRILGTVTAALGDQAAAEDCVQDAFERAYAKWPTFEPRAPAEAWVYRIAINAAISYRRKMQIREVGEIIRRIGRPRVAADPQVIAENRDLADALAQLPPKQSAAIVLRYYHGYSNRAISRNLGMPERTVASRLAVARRRLREMLKDSYGPEAGRDFSTAVPKLEAAAS